ncbi:MAG: iron-containing alcohol dehydrogenase [Mangrovibacterium sp.]
MLNFTYKNPTKILFGKGQIANITKEIPQDAKILLTYGGGSIFKNGVYDQVRAATEGLNIIEFGGIEPNPKYETLMQAVEICRQEKITFLLAVGGGSVLDGTKFIAAAHFVKEDDTWDILKTGGKIIKQALPIGCVMTLPATGSEMNGNAVISKLTTKEKLGMLSPLVYPQFSVLDPDFISSLPENQIANGIIDSYVHTIEQYLTYDVDSPLQDRYAESILNTLIEEGPKVIANNKDYNAAANYMWCATNALNHWIAVGVVQDWSTHQIGHELTALHGIDHAKTLAIVLPGVMNFKRKDKAKKILQYGSRIFGISSGSDEERIDATIHATESFFNKLGVSCRLSDYNVTEESILTIENRFKDRKKSDGEHRDIDWQATGTILRSRL